MFASVITTKGQASREEMKRSINPLLPLSQSLPGFKGVLVLQDEKGGKGMAITFFESEEVYRTGAEARDRLRKEAASEVGVSITSLEGFEVVLASGLAELIQV